MLKPAFKEPLQLICSFPLSLVIGFYSMHIQLSGIGDILFAFIEFPFLFRSALPQELYPNCQDNTETTLSGLRTYLPPTFQVRANSYFGFPLGPNYSDHFSSIHFTLPVHPTSK